MMTHKNSSRARYHVSMKRLIAILTLFLILNATTHVHAQGALGPGFYDQTLPAIVYENGTWTVFNDVNNYGGSRTLTSTVNSQIRFNIWGDGFTLYYTRFSGAGAVIVYVNEVAVTTIDYNSPITLYYQSVTISGLGWGGDGIHNIRIGRTSPVNNSINLDAIMVLPHVVYPTAIVPTIPPINVTVIVPTQPAPTGTQYAYIGNWDDMPTIPPPEITDDPSITRFDVMDSNGDERAVMVRYQIDAGQILTAIFSAGGLVVLIIIMILLARSKS